MPSDNDRITPFRSNRLNPARIAAVEIKTVIIYMPIHTRDVHTSTNYLRARINLTYFATIMRM